MSVLIKGMNKPNRCTFCRFNIDDAFCNITNGQIDRDDYTCDIECPIIELPKHGRLIDADHLMLRVNYSRVNNPHNDGNIFLNHANEHWHFADMILQEPTVIEENKGGDYH